MNKTYSYQVSADKLIQSPTYLILVSGPSCGGKTTFIEKAEKELGESVSIIGTDQYYMPVSPDEDPNLVNFDDPSRVKLDELYNDVINILKGETVKTPLYDYKIHSSKTETKEITKPRVLIVEGIFALLNDDLNKLAEIKIFVEAAQVICFSRRLKRDIEERGRTIDDVTTRFVRDVWPSTVKFVVPSKKEADIVIQNNEPEKFIGMMIVMNHIKTELS